MDDKYKIMTLKYLYGLLDLKKYEKILESNDLESIVKGYNDFKYFSLLSDGDISSFSDEEIEEFMSYDKYSIEELLDNEMLSSKFFDFIKQTFQKYYFSNVNDEYIYYNGHSEMNMVPDDAFALQLNYRIKYDQFTEEKQIEVSDIVSGIINDIQFNVSKKNNIKVGVIENNGLSFDNDILSR